MGRYAKRDIRLDELRKKEISAVGMVENYPVLLHCATTYCGNNIYWDVSINELIKQQFTFEGDYEITYECLDSEWCLSFFTAKWLFKRVAKRYNLRILDKRVSSETAAKELGLTKADLNYSSFLYKKVIC